MSESKRYCIINIAISNSNSRLPDDEAARNPVPDDQRHGIFQQLFTTVSKREAKQKKSTNGRCEEAAAEGRDTATGWQAAGGRR
jgi:hypothetical protein